MRSGWFFGTTMWKSYLEEYAKTRPDCLREWKTSPLANDHDFTEFVDDPAADWEQEQHYSQVIDLQAHKWSNIRKSYRGLINRAGDYVIKEDASILNYSLVHFMKFGNVRNKQTFEMQQEWMNKGYALSVSASDIITFDSPSVQAAAFWIIYNNCAFYASGPSIKNNIQHAVIWKSLQILKARDVYFVEMGQIDGKEEGTRGLFKTGFGGEAKPFTIVRRA
jgi:hypothetical protein